MEAIIKPKFKECEVHGVRFRAFPNGSLERYSSYDCSQFKYGWNIVNVKPQKNRHNKYYYKVQINGKKIACHRIIYYAFYPEEFDIYDDKQEIDHANTNSLDNNITNLRLATHAENCSNRNRDSNARKYQGLPKNIAPHYDPKCDAWYWMIRMSKNGRYTSRCFRQGPGRIPDILPPVPEELIEIRNQMIEDVHGRFGRTDS